jgi:SAM-dependent methyltransferase
VRPERLVCPRCKARLSESGAELACDGCGASYETVDGVAVLLPGPLSEQQESQARYFDSEFSGFSETYAPENWRLSFNHRIFDALGIVEGRGPYLDVGVGGSGATVIEAARAGVDATGCDLSVAGVLHASRLARREGVEERASFVVCAAESLPFEDGAFACASAVAVLEHLDDGGAVAELGRVVRPGGLVWITVPLAYRYMLPPLWPVYRRHDRKLGHKRHYDVSALEYVLGGSGMRRVETTYTGHAVKILQLVLERLLPASWSAHDRIWWSLERLDLRAARRAYGALQLNAVFRRPDEAATA